MRRRDFIGGVGGAVAWPLSAWAQQGERVRRIGVLTYGTDTEPVTTLTTKLLREELQKLGWIEGRNLRLDFRFGFGDATKTRVFAADLVQLAPDVIVASYGVALGAVLQQTKTIPIVFIGAGDPVEVGTVRNPAHPEGNATGFANAFGSLGGKWLELLKEAAPNVTRVLHLYPAAAFNPGSSFLRSVEAAAQSMQVQIVAIPVSDANGAQAPLEAFAAEPNGGLLPSPGIFAIAPDELMRLAAQYRLPTVSGVAFAAAGGLIGYGSDLTETIRGAATYVGRLLGGAKISDLPVQYPTKFRLVINLKTADALGLEVPPSILARADEVIE
jgi:putative tryptophan/tyrosine transport system substrate-binding protein